VSSSSEGWKAQTPQERVYILGTLHRASTVRILRSGLNEAVAAPEIMKDETLHVLSKGFINGQRC